MEWVIVWEIWLTDVFLETLDMLSEYCSEFLVHAADVEGLCNGIDEELVHCKICSQGGGD
jgi:phosphoribosylformimino-5-aminoimidazole carboxamide ribotide isomerase